MDAVLVSLPRHRWREECKPRRGRQSGSKERQGHGGILFDRRAAVCIGHAQAEGPGFIEREDRHWTRTSFCEGNRLAERRG